MPPGGKLPESVIADFAAWIKHGAADPRVGVASQEKRIDFEKAKKYGIEVFEDNRTGNLLFLSETGSIAVLPKETK